MKKAIISVLAILLVSVMMATMLSGCVPYNALGLYSFNSGTTFTGKSPGPARAVVYQGEDDTSKYKVEISANVWYSATKYDKFEGYTTYTGAATACDVFLSNDDGSLSVSASLYTTNGKKLGATGSVAKLEVDNTVWNAVTFTKD